MSPPFAPLARRIHLVWSVLFWPFGVGIAIAMLSMSLRGALKGGAAVNVIVSAYAMAWILALSAAVVATWKMRGLEPDVSLMQLARARRPLAPELASAGRWARAAACGFAALLASLLPAVVIRAMVGP